jgi:formylglycine-generating enzyme required for sulfatase activity
VSPDPVEKYRQQLAALENMEASELEKPETRMERAIARYHVGNLEAALEDLNFLLASATGQTPSAVLQYRTLALARMGQADDARQSLAKYLEQPELPESSKPYVEIQVPAWLGESAAASIKLESAANQASWNQDELYNIACAAALCAQATSAKDPDQSQRFKNRAMEILEGAILRGYSNETQVQEDPDFAILHGDARFASMLEGIDEKVRGEFWMGDREVTRGEFEQFVNDASYAATEKPVDWQGVDTEISPTADHPVQQVNWYDGVLYCNWLSLREGLRPCYERTDTKEKGPIAGTENDAWRMIPGATGYRLPGEAEWDYACQAGTSTEFCSGDDGSLLAGYCRMYPSKRTSMCGEKLPNAWGLHDVHGNVWEWCEVSEGPHRVLRGGSWSDGAADCRTAHRLTGVPTIRTNDGGFRLALSLEKLEE